MSELNESFSESLSALCDDESSELEVARVLRALAPERSGAIAGASASASESDDPTADPTMTADQPGSEGSHGPQDSPSASVPKSGETRQETREKLARLYALRDQMQGTPLIVSAGSTSFADRVMERLDAGDYESVSTDVSRLALETSSEELEAHQLLMQTTAAGDSDLSLSEGRALPANSVDHSANDASWFNGFIAKSAVAASVAFLFVFGFTALKPGIAPDSATLSPQTVADANDVPLNDVRAVVPEGYSAPSLRASTVAGSSLQSPASSEQIALLPVSAPARSGASSGAPAQRVSVDELVFGLQRAQLENRELRERLQSLVQENQQLKLRLQQAAAAQ